MDMKHLKYFVAIVNYDFNLSKTAEYIYVSQPTLSQFISVFERKHGVDLFHRKNGRLTGLTAPGEKFYNNALKLIDDYNNMIIDFISDNDEIGGEINIGIPPLITSVLFTDFFTDFILNSKNIKFNLTELGASSLKSELVLGELDLAVLLKPEGINPDLIDSTILQDSELAIFMSPNNPLSQKDILEWEDLALIPLATFDDTFMIHHLTKDKFSFKNIRPNIVVQSKSWDFLTTIVKNHDEMVTILPYDLIESFNFANLKSAKIKEPIPWIVTLTRLKKQKYSNIEQYVYDKILDNFGC